MEIGKAIRKIRHKKGLNQKEFSNRVNITQSYLSQLESGKRTPSIALLELIAAKLNSPLSFMFWYGLEEKDIKEDKKQAYRFLKASIDSLINELV